MNGDHIPKRLKLTEEKSECSVEHEEDSKSGTLCKSSVKREEDVNNDEEKKESKVDDCTKEDVTIGHNGISNNAPVAGPSISSISFPNSTVEPSTSPSAIDRSNAKNSNQKSSIFKMDDNCFDELFNYLSFEDLLSFGKTCKTLKSYVSNYYNRHFSHRNYEIEHNGIYANYALFVAVRQFITRLQIRFCSFKPLYRINSQIEQFSSLKHITFFNMDLMEPDYDRIQNIFNKIESIYLSFCLPEFCNKCMDLCENLKRISMRHITLSSFLDGEEYPWLSGRYPKLEQFEFILLREWPVDGLNGFLEKNSNIKFFGTSGLCLWINRDQLLGTTAKLDILEIRMMEVYDVTSDEFIVPGTRMKTICKLINQLFERGFYQRLHFFITNDEQIINIDEVVSLNGLEKLCILNFKENFNLHPLTLVKELIIINGIEKINIENLAKKCTKLERLYLSVRTIEDILPFICQSVKLHKITLLNYNSYMSRYCTDIVMKDLNMKRELLPATRKLIIFVPDELYLQTKRTARNGNVNMSAVELRRGVGYHDFLDNEIQ